MEGLPRYYTLLFNAVTDALEALQAGEYTKAELLLLNGQHSAEEAYLQETDGEERIKRKDGYREPALFMFSAYM